jgi:serine/threonine-protein kinase
MIGQIVGNYKIEKKLGEGGMGAVYMGVDTMLDREVAIKALKPELASQTSIVERFRSEAVTLAKLNHPNIATLYSMFRQGEELYMVLEFVRGETLDDVMKRRGKLSAEEAIPVFCQVLDGIDHAHELGIVHRDIKPANMMLTEKGTLKVLDFGIARLLGSARMTRAGNIIGTLEYMAPEQVRGQETDGRSDIYALGMMLYEVLTGKLPFDTDNEFELMKLQTEVTPPSPREINPEITEDVEAAIMKAIEKDPEARFQTAGEFRELLIEAGFAASGTMHGATGTFKKASTHPSRPSQAAISQPVIAATDSAVKETRLGEAAPASASKKGAIKETRLGQAAPAANMKATRLGVAAAPTAAGPQANAAEAEPSFFSKLSMVHYVGSGAVLVILLAVAAAVPFLMNSGGKPAEAVIKAEPKTEKPNVVTMPQQQSQQLQAPPAQQPDLPQISSPQMPADSAAKLPGSPAGGGELTPISPDAPKDKTATGTVAQKPAAPKKEAAPPNLKPKGGAKSGGRAEQLLTGN